EGKADPEAPGQQATKYLSRGLTRSRTDNLVVMRSSPATASFSSGESQGSGSGGGSSKITSLASHGATARAAGHAIEGAVALKQETQHDLSPTEKLQALHFAKAGTAAREQVAPTKAERRAEAKAKGYEGEMCSECGNFTLVRNGTCMKCDTCGS